MVDMIAHKKKIPVRSRLGKKCQISTCPYEPRIEVPYTGTFDTDIVVVGESPGRTECAEKKPFVGASGMVLNAVLQSIGYPRASVLIANSCRCTIDKDNDGIKVQNLALKTCRPYLEAALKRAKPRVIITLGAVALQQVLGKKKILENRGRFFWSEEFNCQVFVTVHPAFILRGAGPKFWEKPEHMRSMKENLLFMDFGQVKKFLETGSTAAVQEVAETYQEGTKTSLDELFKPGADMIAHVRPEEKAPRRVVAVDFETTGINLFDPEVKVLSVSFCANAGKPIVFFADDEGNLPKHVLKVLQDPDIAKVVASRPFDENVCKLKLGITMGGVIHDVLVMAHLLDENYNSYSLESVADIYTPLKGIKELALGMRASLGELPKAQLLKYNAVDADATIRAFHAMRRLLAKDKELARYYTHFILPVLDMFSEIYLHGGTLDTKQLKKDEKALTELVEQLHSEALEFVPEAIKEAHAGKLKLSRLDLVRDMIFSHPAGLRLRPNPQYITPKTQKPQCTEDHLKQFNHPFISRLLRMKKAEKIRGTYLAKFWKSIRNNKGQIFPSTFLNATVTGRTVMKDPTIQTIPQRGEFAPYAKRCFVAPKGWLIGARDLGQSEIRIMGWLAHDENILKALRENIDIHTMTAAIVNNVPVTEVTKEMRQKAKGVNFGFLYGMQAKSFRTFARDEYGLTFTESECEEVRRRFFAPPTGYYALPRYHTKQERLALRQGWVRSPLGRMRRLPMAFAENFAERGNAARQAINMPIQSFSSDLGLIGMLLFYRKLKEKGYLDRIKPMWFIHDSVMFIAKERLMPTAMKLLKKCMEEASAKYIEDKFKLKIGYPITSDGKVGSSWASMEEWDDKTGKVKVKS